MTHAALPCLHHSKVAKRVAPALLGKLHIEQVPHAPSAHRHLLLAPPAQRRPHGTSVLLSVCTLRASGRTQQSAPEIARSVTQQRSDPAVLPKVMAGGSDAAALSRGMSGFTIASATANPSGSGADVDDPVVQYVVLRRDLWTELGWPLGSVVAQACHASTAALWQSRNTDTTQQYCAPDRLDHMRKVILEIKGEAQLLALAEKLAGAGVAHKLWVEQPENLPTCLATAPATKAAVGSHFKKLKLCKGT